MDTGVSVVVMPLKALIIDNFKRV